MPKEKKLPKLTKKQKGFVRDYLETGNGTQSALNNYDTKDYKTASVIAAENLDKPNISAYLESKAEKAAEFVFQLAESGENESVRLNASKDILDRAGYKPVERSVSVVAQFNIENKEQVEGIASKVLEQMRNDESNG